MNSNTTIMHGWLLWWTIHQNVYDLFDLRKAGEAAKIPQQLLNGLQGAKVDQAFKRVANLGTGEPSDNQNKDQKSWYATAKTSDGDYVLSRLTIDSSAKEPTLVHIGNLHLNGFDIAFDPATEYQAHKTEVDHLLDRLRQDLLLRTGRIDDNKVRSLVLGWLRNMHRVALRNTGGVYYLPNTPDIDIHILAVQTWFENTGLGTFSANPVQKNLVNLDLIKVLKRITDKVTLSSAAIEALRIALQDAIPQQVQTPIVTQIVEKTISVDIVESAITELNKEIDEINESLHNYQQSSGMNAGSRMYSAGTQREACKKLLDKVDVLQDNLGDKIGLVRSKLEIVLNRAASMADDSAKLVELERSTKELLTGKPAKPVTAHTNGNGKKSGTVKSRKDRSV